MTPTDDRASRHQWQRILLPAILVLATALRFYRIGYQSFWNDEGTSVALASRSISLILEGASRDIHPPLYYLLLHGWMQLWGQSEAAVRSLSALLGVAAVAMTYMLARRMGNRHTAILASLFAMLAPLQVYYSQEARMYMLAATLACASMGSWSLMQSEASLDTRAWRRRAGLHLLTTTLLICTHYVGFTIVLAQNLGMLWWLAHGSDGTRQQRITLLARWTGLQFLIAALFVPWLTVSWRALTQWPAVGHTGGPIAFAQSAAETLALGTAMQPSNWLLMLGYAAGVLALIGALAELCRRASRSFWSLYLLVPLGTMGLYSLARPMFKPKFALLVAPAFAVLQAHGVLTLARWGQRRWSNRVGVALGLALTAIPLATSGVVLWHQYHDPHSFRDDYRGIVMYIEAAASPHDAMLINAPSQIETIDLYTSGKIPAYPLPLQRPIDEQSTAIELERIVARHARIYGIFWATDESDPDRFIESWLDRNTYRALDAWFGNLRLVVYATPDPTTSLTTRAWDCRLGQTIALESSAVSPGVESGTILQVELAWRALESIPHPYKVFLHLLDSQDQIIAQRDAEPVGYSRPTDSWDIGERILDRHGILVRPGTPPGTYRLIAGIYHPESGQRLPVTCKGEPTSDVISLGKIIIEPATTPPPLSALDMTTPDDIALAGIRLLGHSAYGAGHAHAPDTPLRPNEALEIVLFWQRLDGESATSDVTFQLRDSRGNRQMIEVAIGPQNHPPDVWDHQQIVREVRRISISEELHPGRLQLLIQDANERWQRIAWIRRQAP